VKFLIDECSSPALARQAQIDGYGVREPERPIRVIAHNDAMRYQAVRRPIVEWPEFRMAG